jgi:asparagine synthase (glutamine-hydrolysing)
MCGIAGFVNLQANSKLRTATLKAMTDSIAHRGPDGEGQFIDDQVALGNRRLAIIDIPSGKQPMTREDGRYVITFNGEIYNYLELRRELQAKGYTFQTKSDTEVILVAYIVYGTKCLERLNGMFAFVIYDRKKRLLFAARDRFGVKPFYYYFRDGKFVFASEIKAILQVLPKTAKLNKEALSEYLTFQFCLGDKTLFAEIKKLPPAHFLLLTNRRLTVKRWWDLNFSTDTHHTEEYFRDRLRELLENSVRLRLRSDVPVGAYLSGGLDSSTVTSIAARFYPKRFRTFSGRFVKKGYDETSYARLVAKHADAIYQEVIIRPKDFIENMPKLLYYMDEPAAGPGLFPQYMVSRLASRYLKVVLGGQGGDETFGGYARYLILYLEASLKGAIFETQVKDDPRFVVTFSSLLQSLPMLREYVPLMQDFWRKGLFDTLSDRYFRLIDRGNGLREIINREFLPDNDDRGKLAFDEIFQSREFGPLFNRMTYFDMTTLLPALLHVEDRMSMASSLESRTPLLDYRIAELVASMPAPVKFKNGEAKHILKAAVRRIIPEEILLRKDKMGFPVPLTEWLCGPLKDFVGDILLGETARQRGLYDLSSVEVILNQERKFDRRIWGLLNLELWFRTFIDKPITRLIRDS